MTTDELHWMKLALQLAKRGYGSTSPNPMVGAVLVRKGIVIGRGWHKRAGRPHAEIEALSDAARRGNASRGATLFVTLEPCSTHGRTPPCTRAIIAAGIRRVVVGATDPNPKHRGRGLSLLRREGVTVTHGVLADECSRLNEAFNHWIVRRTPFVTVKAAMSLDGKIATASGESKWITGERARAFAMKLRGGSDAILAGVNTIRLDDPALTFRPPANGSADKRLRRVILDSRAETPLAARVVSDECAALTTIVVTEAAPAKRVAALAERARVWVAPEHSTPGEAPRPDLKWVLQRLGEEGVCSLLVEGGGEVNASFLLGGFAHRVAFFYAPKILGGSKARRAVGGCGATGWPEIPRLEDIRWRRLGADLLLTARVSAEPIPR